MNNLLSRTCTLNKKKLPVNQLANIIIGSLGMMIIITGNLLTSLPQQKICYLAGALLMLLAAVFEKQPFFITLQAIILSGTVSAYLPIASQFRCFIPMSIGTSAIIYFRRQKQLQDYTTMIGYGGIMLLALGYAISHPVIYCLGGAALTYYAWVSFCRGVTIALLWAVLNLMYTISSVVSIYHYL